MKAKCSCFRSLTGFSSSHRVSFVIFALQFLTTHSRRLQAPTAVMKFTTFKLCPRTPAAAVTLAAIDLKAPGVVLLGSRLRVPVRFRKRRLSAALFTADNVKDGRRSSAEHRRFNNLLLSGSIAVVGQCRLHDDTLCGGFDSYQLLFSLLLCVWISRSSSCQVTCRVHSAVCLCNEVLRCDLGTANAVFCYFLSVFVSSRLELH